MPGFIEWIATDSLSVSPEEETPILFVIEGETYEIEPGSTDKKYVYWDSEDPNIFKTTDNLLDCVGDTKWYLCRNENGVPYWVDPVKLGASDPQELGVGASPTFADLTLTGLSPSSLVVTDINSKLDSVVLGGGLGFISGIFGIIPSEIDHDSLLNVHQDVNTDATPQFAGLILQKDFVGPWFALSLKHANSGSVVGPIFDYYKSRGTIAVPADVVNGDYVGAFQTRVYSGGTFFATTAMIMAVDGTFVSGQRPPSKMTFWTNLANTGQTHQMVLDSYGRLGIGWDYGIAPVEKLSVNGVLALAEVSIPSVSDNFGKFFVKTDNNPYYLREDGLEGDLLNPLGSFVPYSENPVLTPEGNEGCTEFASVVRVDSTYHMYYGYHNAFGWDMIGHATSTDGKTWTKDVVNNPVLQPGGFGEWDEEGTGTPTVWKEGVTWYMLYRGGWTICGIGLATSSDGVNWIKSELNPVLQGTEGQWDDILSFIDTWGLIKVGSTYYTYYNATQGGVRKTGLATSTNLTTWTKDGNNPIFVGGRFCPDVFKYNNYYYLVMPHFTLGNTNYVEFELYRDVNPTFYPADRVYLGIIKETAALGWDGNNLDTPFVLTDNVYRNSFNASGGEIWMYYSGRDNANVWTEGLLISSRVAGLWQRSNRSQYGYGLGIFGKVGIGIANPSELLEVAGVVKATDLTLSAPVNIYSLSHDSFANYSADKHIDHTGVSISPGTGMSGGGTIAATRTLSLSHLGIESLTDPNADKIFFWDDSADGSKFLGCGNSIAITNTTLDTIQDIRTTATPQFAGLGVGVAAKAGVRLTIKSSDNLGIIGDQYGYTGIRFYGGTEGLLNIYNIGGGTDLYGSIVFSTSTSVLERVRIGDSGNVGIGTVGVGLASKLHVKQASTTMAVSVLLLDQADVSEEFIRFIGTAADNVITQSIVAAADVGAATIAGYIKVYVQDDGNQITDQAYYMPIYTLTAP